MKSFKQFFIILFAALAVLFAFRNSSNVSVNLPLTGITMDMPAFLVIFCSFIFGCFVMWVVNVFNNFHLKKELSHKKTQVRALENELSGLGLQERVNSEFSSYKNNNNKSAA